jgi:hypothetical protein
MKLQVEKLTPASTRIVFVPETPDEERALESGTWQPKVSAIGGGGEPGPQGPPGTDGADGAPGADGVDGNRWLGGSGAPSDLIGNDDDYYYCSSNGDIHFKGNGAWSLIGNIMGPTGATGDTGPQGPQGGQGVQGETGAAGADGAQGPAGNDGAQGIQGIQGIQGETGLPGADGADGGTFTSTDMVNLVYPVGSIYVSTVSTNPGTLFGTGTWAAFGAGRALVGLDAGQTEFDTVEETGGAKTHTLVEAEMPAHVHNQTRLPTATGGVVGFTVDTSMSGTPGVTGVDTGSKGGGGAHNNLQPYIVVYMWKRTA